jgi:hypothetical protein
MTRANSARMRVRLSRSIASPYSRSAFPPSLSSARERASAPSAQSLPLTLVVSDSRRMGPVPRSGDPGSGGRFDQFDKTPGLLCYI